MICARCGHSFTETELKEGLFRAVHDISICLKCVSACIEGWFRAARGTILEKPEGYVS